MIKNSDFSFIVLSENGNIAPLKTTINSLKFYYPDNNRICVVPKHVDNKIIVELNDNVCLTYKGDVTWSSLINTGLLKSEGKWNFVIVSGSWISNGLIRKFEQFIKNENDILYPIVNRKMNFVEGSINGLLIHKNTFKKIGLLPSKPMMNLSSNEFELTKLFWSLDAIEKGCRFKGIVGVKVC